MERAEVDGLELEYELHGSGEPVVLVHWGIGAAWGEPLQREPALSGFRLLRYHRAGFAGSGRRAGPITFAEHAGHCAGLLRQLEIEPIRVRRYLVIVAPPLHAPSLAAPRPTV